MHLSEAGSVQETVALRESALGVEHDIVAVTYLDVKRDDVDICNG